MDSYPKTIKRLKVPDDNSLVESPMVNILMASSLHTIWNVLDIDSIL